MNYGNPFHLSHMNYEEGNRLTFGGCLHLCRVLPGRLDDTSESF